MNQHDQQNAIAEACGWRIGNPENDRVDYRWWWPPGVEPTPNTICGDKPPDYLNDLNAMHEAEKVLPPKKRADYIRRLNILVEIYGEGFQWHATAQRRAEAFLQTMNLWQTEPSEEAR